MDWDLAIGRHREALVGILAALVAMATSDAVTLPRHLHRYLLRLLRPAEAAARRLVIALARTLPAPEPRNPLPRSGPKPAIPTNGVGTGIVMPRGYPPRRSRRLLQNLSLPLFDPLRLPGKTPRRPAPAGVPRISVPGLATPFSIAVRRPPSPDDPIDAARLRLRLRAATAIMDDLPAAAERFARRQIRPAAGAQARKFRRIWPLKPGRPPGWSRRPVHAVHEVLNEAHWLALTALERRDTS